jgi:KilA-N domain
MPAHQLSLSLISHKVENAIVEQRASDGYINATAMCKAAGKLFADYDRLGTTKQFMAELEVDMGIPISTLVQSIKGGSGPQGTWVHPHVAINLASWLSAKFAVQVSKWVHDWMSGKLTPTKLPYHLERHMLNLHKIPAGYFSVLQEMTNFLVGPLEANGYRMPEKLMPDISQAKMLCKHLREQCGIDTSKLFKYIHTFPDGREVEANLYDVEHLGVFRKLMASEWMTQRAPGYFQKLDPQALPALDKILLLSASAPAPKLAANKPKFKKKA